MEYLYKCVQIYVDVMNNLYVVPTSRSEKWGGAIMDIDLITQLNSPYTDYELEETLLKALQLCYTKEPSDNLKSTAIEKFLNIKGYGKAVKDKKLITFEWSKETGFTVTPTCKLQKKGYINLDDNKIFVLGHDFEKDALAKAVRESITLSIIK